MKYEIAKYNPIYYDMEGYYNHDEWTNICDVGKSYENKVFTIYEYLDIELRYINTIIDIMKFVGSKFLTIQYFELDKKHAEKLILNSRFSYYDLPLLHYVQTFNKNKHITMKMIAPIIKLCMRDYLYVILVDRKHRLKIDFGYELYLRLECCIDKKVLDHIVQYNGLYLNPRVAY